MQGSCQECNSSDVFFVNCYQFDSCLYGFDCVILNDVGVDEVELYVICVIFVKGRLGERFVFQRLEYWSQ